MCSKPETGGFRYVKGCRDGGRTEDDGEEE